MDQMLNDEIIHRYPDLYSGVYYLGVGPGWYRIIDDLSSKLEKLIIEYRKLNPDCERYPMCSDVKEKYGELRFYMTCATDEMLDHIHDAEKKSSITCEGCGDPGVNGCMDGWWTVLCDKCKVSFD